MGAAVTEFFPADPLAFNWQSGWPLLATPVAAGASSLADDLIEDHLSLDQHLVRIPEATFLLRVTGDALAEVGVRDGDLLVMDRAAPATKNSVVLAMIAGDFALARIGHDTQGRRVLCGIGDHGNDQQLGEDVTIVGVARWTIHRLWPGRAALV